MSSKPILSFITVVLLVGCKSQPRNQPGSITAVEAELELVPIKRATPERRLIVIRSASVEPMRL
jgi:hypothetical protein